MPQLHFRHFETLNQSTFFAAQTCNGLAEIVDLIADVIGPAAHSREDLLHRRGFIQTLDQLDSHPRLRSHKTDTHMLGHNFHRRTEHLETKDPRVEIQGLLDASYRHTDMVKTGRQISKDRRDLRVHHAAQVTTNADELCLETPWPRRPYREAPAF